MTLLDSCVSFFGYKWISSLYVSNHCPGLVVSGIITGINTTIGVATLAIAAGEYVSKNRYALSRFSLAVSVTSNWLKTASPVPVVVTVFSAVNW
ncbi:hypothetical protein SDC9_100785 [bioreactor metagenome]|uniref:Uncharacterized protein n=1 Tax=bioreactor metagenome TaxID=1076179 RepID=A0A645AT17_9ZZZZ